MTHLDHKCTSTSNHNSTQYMITDFYHTITRGIITAAPLQEVTIEGQ